MDIASNSVFSKSSLDLAFLLDSPFLTVVLTFFQSPRSGTLETFLASRSASTPNLSLSLGPFVSSEFLLNLPFLLPLP